MAFISQSQPSDEPPHSRKKSQIGQFWNMFRRSKKSEKNEIERYWNLSAYVTDDKRAERMRCHLIQAAQALADNNAVKVTNSIIQARREHILARQERTVFYWRSWSGIAIAALMLFVFSALLTIGLVFKLDFDSEKYILLFAAIGGGVGGCCAVLIQVIDVDPHSEVVSQQPWYWIKPFLGAVLGMITYLTLRVSIDLVVGVGNSGGVKVHGLEEATIIGFLSGFFESFSKGILARTSGQYTEQKDKENK